MTDQVRIEPKPLEGSIVIPPSKSDSHRAILAAALAEGESKIENILLSEDIKATMAAACALGAQITVEDDDGTSVVLHIVGNSKPSAKSVTIDCGESGSTLRFIIPIMAINADQACVSGRGRLSERPLTPYYRIFKEQNIIYNHEIEGMELPLTFSGRLEPGEYAIPGNISSQFITGLLYALPLLTGDSIITITSPLESQPYVDITLKVLRDFGIIVENENYQTFKIPGNQSFQARTYRVEGDYSQAAFFLVAGSIGKSIACRGLSEKTAQGDSAILEIIREMGGNITYDNKGFTARPMRTKGTVIDVTQCPDLVPVLAVLAALSMGKTEIVGAERLRIKESDRLAAMADVLTTLGGNVKETADGLVIHGVDSFVGGTVDGHNDHRIVMAAAIASIRCQGSVTIGGAGAVAKSYPHFFDDFRNLGGEVHGIDF